MSLPNERVARREKALPIDVRSDKRVAALPCLKDLGFPKDLGTLSSVSHVYVRSAWPLRCARVHQKEMVLNCRKKSVVKSGACLVFAGGLANRVCHSDFGDMSVPTKTVLDGACQVQRK